MVPTTPSDLSDDVSEVPSDALIREDTFDHTERLSLLRVSKTYFPNVLAVSRLTTQLHAKELVYVTGPSGAGKTTLLRLLAGFEQPSAGAIDYGTTALAKLSGKKLRNFRQSIGFVFQDFRLIQSLTVFENISLPMDVQFIRVTEQQRRAAELLDALGLLDKMHLRVQTLSRGEQQRVAVARALATNPSIILADEPTGNLDAESSARVMDLLERHRKQGALIVVVTHDLALLKYYPGRVLEMSASFPLAPETAVSGVA